VRLAPATYRRVTLAALTALVFIVITGGAVRLTGSGLGCPDWPTCADNRLVPVPEAGYHAMVEFVNRAITGLVSVAVILAVLGSLVRSPRRRDLTLLSLGLVAGVIAQIVLGGLTVIFELKPQFVMAHFLLSMVLIANAVVLHHRAGLADDSPPRGSDKARAGQPQPALVTAATTLAVAVLALGTVVTSSGPHGGDPDAERFAFSLAAVARLHGLAVVGFLAVVVVIVVQASGARRYRLRRQAVWVLAVGLAQGAIGYLQYFTGVPVLLVGAHIAGATAVWITIVKLQLTARAGSLALPTPQLTSSA